MHDLNKVCEWLLSCRGIVSAEPVRVTINRGPKSISTHEGVRYTIEMSRTAGEREVTEGRAKEGDKYRETRIYLLGNLPKWYGKPKCCFTLGNAEWYCCCYADATTAYKRLYAEHHPFGPSWMLAEWKQWPEGSAYHGWKIDTGENVIYRRYPISIERS